MRLGAITSYIFIPFGTETFWYRKVAMEIHLQKLFYLQLVDIAVNQIRRQIMLSFQIHQDSQLKIWWKVYLFPLYLKPTKTTETVPCTSVVVGVTPCDWNIKLSENHFNVTKQLKWKICGISFINLQQGWTKPMKDITHPFHPYPTCNVQDLSPSHLRVSKGH